MSTPSSATPPPDQPPANSPEAMYAVVHQVLADRRRNLESVSPGSATHELSRALLTALPDALTTGVLTQVEPMAYQLGAAAQRQGVHLPRLAVGAHREHDRIMDSIISHIMHADHAGLVTLLQISHVLRDLTDAVISGYQDEATSLLTEQALTDGLTGIANRRAFDARLEEELRRAERLGHGVALVLLDIDGLKRMNDAHGHAHGDALVCAVATVLREQARGIDLVARIEGDEFAVILPEGTQGGTDALVQRLAQAVGSRQVEGTIVRVSAGVAVYPEDGTTPPVLMQHADHRMYAAKRHAGGRG